LRGNCSMRENLPFGGMHAVCMLQVEALVLLDVDAFMLESPSRTPPYERSWTFYFVIGGFWLSSGAVRNIPREPAATGRP
jgi:hypothetical protein